MITGMTNKQFALARFWRALEAYKVALQSGDSHAIVATSLAIHAAKGGVPKRLWPLVGRAFRETSRTTSDHVRETGK